MALKTKTRLRWYLVLRSQATQCGSDYGAKFPQKLQENVNTHVIW